MSFLLQCMQKMKALALTIRLINSFHQGVWTLSLQYYYLSDSRLWHFNKCIKSLWSVYCNNLFRFIGCLMSEVHDGLSVQELLRSRLNESFDGQEISRKRLSIGSCYICNFQGKRIFVFQGWSCMHVIVRSVHFSYLKGKLFLSFLFLPW